jgi:hypothetical protein
MTDTADSAAAHEFRANLAEGSRPNGVAWRAKKIGARRGVKAKRASKMNWFHGLIWPRIHAAAESCRFSAVGTAKYLQRMDPILFKTFHPGTMQKWLEKGERRWNEKTLRYAEKGSSVTGTGRVGLLKAHPDVVEAIMDKLLDLRKAAIPVNRILVRTIMLAIVKDKIPHMLKRLKCSNVSCLFVLMINLF